MERVDIVITYSVEMPEVDKIYKEGGDPVLINKKICNLIDEVYNDPFYFIERDPTYKTYFDIMI